MTETQLLAEIRLALGRDPRVVLWRNNTGMTRESDTGRPVRYGLCVGSSDLVGIVTMANGCGRFVAFEVKTERGRVSAEQALFLGVVNRRGGYGVVVRSIEDAQRAVDAASAGAVA
jgi:hypothetical protein